jgi:hypothetical protein|tara:strand:- start:254 stop:466 length:213 start_codon:yes stop_codon:yes gene_type:complete
MEEKTMKEKVKIYAAVKFPNGYKGQPKIMEMTLEKHINDYNSTCDNIGDKLQLFLNKDEAEAHLKKVNKL